MNPTLNLKNSRRDSNCLILAGMKDLPRLRGGDYLTVFENHANSFAFRLSPGLQKIMRLVVLVYDQMEENATPREAIYRNSNLVQEG